MTDEERRTQLRQMANIVIDAYFSRDQQFVPEFRPDVEAITYLERPDADKDHPGLRTGVWYDRSDYDPMVTSIEEKKTSRRSKK
jgi:hypothetical protein